MMCLLSLRKWRVDNGCEVVLKRLACQISSINLFIDFFKSVKILINLDKLTKIGLTKRE